MPSDVLFTPFKLGNLEIGNRLAVAPMTRVSATEQGCATPKMADYYRRFAGGGFGLVITEGKREWIQTKRTSDKPYREAEKIKDKIAKRRRRKIVAE